ncbi:hypothetical protein SAMN06265182_1851 [Persephonella hydrogeniphila]|uniref:Uncharacterized protein n=1 Tax=Persephonella hydrogeniphila TaxID=198703 RepID=A0A285NLK8_9AQUI|nr:hypothetical protein [Persephonella hydrogeniphila]SNZ10382.1 hypothetical protein SAMN06265182_1851 [Persephonella hydrogeniphila]
MEKSKGNITVSLNLFDIEEKEAELYSYLFDKEGKLISKKKIHLKDRKGKIELTVKKPDRYLLKIAPDVEDLSQLDRYRPLTETFFYKEEPVHIHLDIPKLVWGCWIKFPYLIKGKVFKDGFPVCIGEVDVYEVDYTSCFLRIPEDILKRLKQDIISQIIRPKIPEFPCGKIPCPEPEFFIPPKPPVEIHPNYLNINIGDNIRLIDIVYSSPESFRKLLIEKIYVFKHILCLPWIYPIWLPYCYKMDKIATAQLNQDGSFQAIVWISVCDKDKPDLYFKVRQRVNGNERIIYRPTPIPCYTYWNHPSGKDVYIEITDPEAVICRPEPEPDTEDIYVMPIGIGWDGWHEITQSHLKPDVIPVPERGLYKGEAPYGTGLDIQMQFHKELKNHGVRYYRWSYRKEGDTDWKPIDTKVTHRYLEMIGTELFINTKNLGPLTVNGTPDLFEIPDPSLDWVIIHRGDRRFAYWQTDTIPDGIYQLKLEMFDINGNKITDPASKNFRFILPTGSEINGVIPVYTNLNISNGDLILNIHINNKKTVADIKDIRFNNTPLGNCQFIEYGTKSEQLTVVYTAKHPDYLSLDFLRSYHLIIRKGINGSEVKTVSANFSVENENLNISIGELLGSEDKCSFSIHLHTFPKTRNGYTTIRAYEDHDVSSFAVTGK